MCFFGPCRQKIASKAKYTAWRPNHPSIWEELTVVTECHEDLKTQSEKSQLQLHKVKQLQETSNLFSCIFSELEWAWDSSPRRQLSVFWQAFLKKCRLWWETSTWGRCLDPTAIILRTFIESHITSELLNLTSAEAYHLSQSMKPAGILLRFDASH